MKKLYSTIIVLLGLLTAGAFAQYVPRPSTGGVATTDIDTTTEINALTTDDDFPTLAANNIFTGANTNSKSGTASVSAMKYSGVPFAGTGTTSFPLLYVNDATATASTTLNTAGTYFGVNTHGTQDLINLMKDGVTFFKVDSSGNITGQTTGYNFYRGTNLMMFFQNGQATAFRSVILAQAGLVGAPSYSIEGDTNTGMWSSVADTMDFSAGGVDSLIITSTGVKIGSTSSSVLKLVKSATATLDFTSTAAQTSAELTITVTGAVDGDDVIVSPPNGSSSANSCFTARVSAADTVSVKFNNFSSGAVDPASGTFRVTLLQF